MNSLGQRYTSLALLSEQTRALGFFLGLPWEVDKLERGLTLLNVQRDSNTACADPRMGYQHIAASLQF